MKKPVFVSFSGRKQVGKDSARDFLIEYFNKKNISYQKYSFADPLKEFCRDVLNIDAKLLWGDDEAKNQLTHIRWDTMPHAIRVRYSSDSMPLTGFMTVREVLQVFGTDIVRTMFDGDAWARAPFIRDWGDTKVVVIGDCRFPNEKEMTEDHEGAVLRISRETRLVDNHPSEVALDGYEFKHNFFNDGTLAELQQGVIKFWEEIAA